MTLAAGSDWLTLTYELAALALAVTTIAVALGYASSHPNGHHPHNQDTDNTDDDAH